VWDVFSTCLLTASFKGLGFKVSRFQTFKVQNGGREEQTSAAKADSFGALAARLKVVPFPFSMNYKVFPWAETLKI